VGFPLAFGVVAILSIGDPFFLVGLVLLGVMLGRGPRWPASLGALAGAGVVGVVVGLIGAVAGSGVWAANRCLGSRPRQHGVLMAPLPRDAPSASASLEGE
jgi:hypothetical protein